MINLKGYNFLFGKKAVSPVIGTILMVAITVIMAGIVGSFVYQTAKPKIPPALASSLIDDPLVAVETAAGDNTPTEMGNRAAKLTWEGGRNTAIAELKAIVTYTDDLGAEQTAVLDGPSWATAITHDVNIAAASTGSLMAVGGSSGYLHLIWVDADNSDDISPGDRLDFYETDGLAGGQGLKSGSDFNVKILHRATEAFVADHIIRIY